MRPRAVEQSRRPRADHPSQRARAAHRTPASPGPERVAWIDAARGLAIVLVVLMHTVDWLTGAGLHLGWWYTLDPAFSALRMPMFFAVSGLLGQGWVRARWPDLLSRKVTNLVWVYLAWQPIGSLAALASSRVSGESLDPVRMLASLAATPLRPRFELWYLWALVVFFLLARATLRRPILFQIGCAAVVSALWLTPATAAGNLGWNGVPRYYLFFLLGCHHRPLLTWLADLCRRRVLVAASLVLAWAALAISIAATGADRLPGPGLAVRIAGLGAGIALAGWLARWRLLTYLGARTMQIYLAHTPLLIVLAMLVHDSPLPALAAGQGDPAGHAGPAGTAVAHPAVAALVTVLPGLAAAAAVGAAILLHHRLVSTRARMLYAAPPLLVRGTGFLLDVAARTPPRVSRVPAATGPAGVPHPRSPADKLLVNGA